MKKITNLLRARGYSRFPSMIHFKDDPDAGGGGSSGGSDDSGDSGGSDDSDDSDDNAGAGDSDNKSDAEKVKLLREVMQKKEKIGDLSSELEKIKGSLKAYDGIDLDEVKQLIKDKKDSETKKLEDKAEYGRVKEQMIEEHKSDMKALQERIDELQGKITDKDSSIDKLTIGHSFDDSKFIKDDLALTSSKARIIYGRHFDITDGKIVGFDKPKGAKNRTPLVDGSGNELSFDDAMQKIINSDPDRDMLILSKKKPGAHSSTDDSGVLPGATKDMTGLDMISAGLNAK